MGGSLYDGRYSSAQGAPPVTRDRAGLEAVLTVGRAVLKSEAISADDGGVSRLQLVDAHDDVGGILFGRPIVSIEDVVLAAAASYWPDPNAERESDSRSKSANSRRR